MPENLQPLKEFDEQDQAVHFYKRESVKSRRTIVEKLFRTHRFQPGQATIDTDAVFPDRARPVTFRTKMRAISSLPAGVIFEFGSSTSGVKLSLTNGILALGVGGVGAAGVSGTAGLPVLAGIGDFRDTELVVAINPGRLSARAWVDGELVIRLDGSTAWTGGVWADSEDGSFAEATNGTSNGEASALETAPIRMTLHPLDVYMGQLPRSFII